jgi:hypothetical protein
MVFAGDVVFHEQLSVVAEPPEGVKVTLGAVVVFIASLNVKV